MNKSIASTPIRISELTLNRGKNYSELSGMVDKEQLYIRVPEHIEIFPRAEWLIGAILLEAMISDRDIEVSQEIVVSELLLSKANELQSLYACMNEKLNVVKIIATPNSNNESDDKTGSYFSGGVDSSHTLVRHMNEITHLVMISEFDERMTPANWQRRVSNQSEFSRQLGKKLIPVESNVRAWNVSRRISWEFAHGLLLASMPGVLGMARMYIPSSHHMSGIIPNGSHPMADPLWSTESTSVIHDGANVRRPEKVRKLLTHQGVADNLRVCWKDNVGNCGHCPKCIRTMLDIRLCKGKSVALPPLDNLKLLKTLKLSDERGLEFLESSMMLARAVGENRIYSILNGIRRRFYTYNMLADIDRLYFFGLLRLMLRKRSKKHWLTCRVTRKYHPTDDLV